MDLTVDTAKLGFMIDSRDCEIDWTFDNNVFPPTFKTDEDTQKSSINLFTKSPKNGRTKTILNTVLSMISDVVNFSQNTV